MANAVPTLKYLNSLLIEPLTYMIVGSNRSFGNNWQHTVYNNLLPDFDSLTFAVDRLH